MGSCLPDLRALLAAFGHLFISSANATTSPPAVTAAEADASFGGRLLVVDGDPARDPARRHGSATIVRICPDGALSLARHGVNDESFPGTSEQYLTDLRRRYEHQP